MSKKPNRKSEKKKEDDGILYKNDEQEYAMVTKKLGNSNFSVRLNMEDADRVGHLCGKLRDSRRNNRARNNVAMGSLVLVSRRDFQDDRVDIIHVYKPEHARELLNNAEYIQDNTTNNPYEDNDVVEEDAGFDFATL